MNGYSLATRFDIIVVGLGAIGSALLYCLARQGQRVLGIEQYSSPHALGSTHGESRITRLAVGEGEIYTTLVRRSHELWREIETRKNTKILEQCGCLVIGTVGGAQRHHVSDFLGKSIAIARSHHIPHEILSPQDVCNRFPQFSIAENEYAYFEPSGGYVRPERCVDAQLALGKDLGAIIHTVEKLRSFEGTGDGGVLLVTDQGQYQSQKLVLCLGPWINEFLPVQYRSFFKVYRQTQYWFPVNDPSNAFSSGAFPVFIFLFEDEPGIMYGFPAINGDSGGIKIASEQLTEPCTPGEVDLQVSPAEVKKMYQLASARIAGLRPQCLKSIVCLYTVTPDFQFVVEQHPELENVTFVSPCSGHGFKHSLGLGEALAHSLLGKPPAVPLSTFSLSRFGI